jgi:hypothetical protein
MKCKTCEDNIKWNVKYPNACQKCGSVGSFETMGTYWEPPDFWYCEGCLDEGYCPRCADDLEWDEEREEYIENPCQTCGWNWGNNDDDYNHAYLSEHECVYNRKDDSVYDEYSDLYE